MRERPWKGELLCEITWDLPVPTCQWDATLPASRLNKIESDIKNIFRMMRKRYSSMWFMVEAKEAGGSERDHNSYLEISEDDRIQANRLVPGRTFSNSFLPVQSFSLCKTKRCKFLQWSHPHHFWYNGKYALPLNKKKSSDTNWVLKMLHRLSTERASSSDVTAMASLKLGNHFSESCVYLIKSFSVVPSYLIVSLMAVLTWRTTCVWSTSPASAREAQWGDSQGGWQQHAAVL